MPPSANKHISSLEDKKEKHTLAVWKDKLGHDIVAADINKKWPGRYYNPKHMNQTIVIQFCKKLATRFDNTGNPNPIIVGKFKSIIVEHSSILLSKI